MGERKTESRLLATQRLPAATAASLPRPVEADRPSAAAVVPSVTRAMALLELLAAERTPMSLARLAHRLELPKSSVHALCHTLLTLGYLRRQTDSSFFLGPAVMPLAAAFVSGTDVVQEFNAVWDELGEPPEETMVLSVLNAHEVVYLAARGGSKPLGLAFRAGMRLPANLAATGRAMLAFLPAGQLHSIYADVVPAPRADGAAVPFARLREELEQTRLRGYSVDDEGVRSGVFCIGAPVFDGSSEVVAGLGICIQKAALQEATLARHRHALLRIAGLLTGRLGGRSRQPAAVGL